MTDGGGSSEFPKNWVALVETTRMLKARSSLLVQSLPDLADVRFAMMTMVKMWRRM
jgi:hypothetical protein